MHKKIELAKSVEAGFWIDEFIQINAYKIRLLNLVISAQELLESFLLFLSQRFREQNSELDKEISFLGREIMMWHAFFGNNANKTRLGHAIRRNFNFVAVQVLNSLSVTNQGLNNDKNKSYYILRRKAMRINYFNLIWMLDRKNSYL